MTYSHALDQLSDWISASHGRPIQLSDGKEYRFSVGHQFSHAEVSSIEQRFSLRFPNAYRELLTRLGHCVIFGRNRTKYTGIAFQRPDDLCAMFSKTSQRPAAFLFSAFFPIGSDYDQAAMLSIEMLPQERPKLHLSKEVHRNWDEPWVGSEIDGFFKDWLVEVVQSRM